MEPIRILIVEDEVLIADTIERYLHQRGYEVVGKAISYEEAVMLYSRFNPDLVLLDIRLKGTKTGIDVAKFIQAKSLSCPYIYLSSQIDSFSIKSAKVTLPAGYLTKPIQKNSLYATIEIALHNYQVQEEQKETIRLYNGKQYFQVPLEDILYLQANHTYVRVALKNAKDFLQRSSLREAIDMLPDGQFVQTHRSYAVNIEKVDRWDNEFLYIEKDVIPISRGRRKEIIELLKRG